MPIGAAIGSAVASMAANRQHIGSVAGIAGNYPVSGIPYPCYPVSGVSASMPVYVDPLVYATETALKQPADKKWRRFQQAMFQIDHVLGFHAEGSGSICLRLRASDAQSDQFLHTFTLPFDCDDPVQWFAEHVLNMDFPNAKRAT